MTTTHSTRNFGLDLLRAAAIIGVFFAHGVTGLGQFGIGVDLFFVLSGFLIGRIYFRLQKADNFHLGSFWVARWWRTLPPYFAALALFAIVEHWIPTNPVRWYYIFFLQTFLGMQGFAHSWSLCVEEHFYLTLPLLAMLARLIFGPRSFRWLIPVAFFMPLVLRVASFLIVGGVANMPDQWYRLTPYHCDTLIAGVYLAYLFVEQPDLFRRIRKPSWFVLPLAPIAMIVSPILTGRPVFEALDTTIIAIGFAGCLRLAYDLNWEPTSLPGRAIEKTVRGIALTSYSIYLVHVLVMTDLHVLLAAWPRGAAKTLFIFAVTIVVCVLFYYLFEKPSIWTRDRFLKRKKAPEMKLSHR